MHSYKTIDVYSDFRMCMCNSTYAGAVAERLSASVGARLGRPDWAPLRYSRIAWWDLRRVTASVGEYAWTFSKTNTCTGICSLPSEYVGSARKKEHWQKC